MQYTYLNKTDIHAIGVRFRMQNVGPTVVYNIQSSPYVARGHLALQQIRLSDDKFLVTRGHPSYEAIAPLYKWWPFKRGTTVCASDRASLRVFCKHFDNWYLLGTPFFQGQNPPMLRIDRVNTASTVGKATGIGKLPPKNRIQR